MADKGAVIEYQIGESLPVEHDYTLIHAALISPDSLSITLSACPIGCPAGWKREPSLLCVSDTWYHSWGEWLSGKVTSDGVPRKVRVCVNPGCDEVEWSQNGQYA